ncbi:MAG: hypothetical protein MI717_14150 [Spirochaetales bacterium]|nr:hypothetical protein [Spirochaetales bacterium]
MKRSLRRFVAPFGLVGFILLISSCPLPITDGLVAAVEDKFSPKINITSHQVNDYYFSTLTISGNITDDSLEVGDGRGQLSKVTFDAWNDSAYRGGITIDTAGVVSRDLSLGALPIVYNPETNLFSVTLDSSGLNTDIEIVIVATDLNNNSTTKIFRLRNSDGPAVEITAPLEGDRIFRTDTYIQIAGTLSNSALFTDSISEIDRVRFTVSAIGLNVLLDLDTLVDQDPTPEGVRYTKNIPFLGTNFVIENQTFTCNFFPPDSGMESNSAIIVEAWDKNNNLGRSEITLIYNDGGPGINILNPTRTGNYYSSLRNGYTIPLEVSITPAATPVNNVYYQIRQGLDPWGPQQSLFAGSFSDAMTFTPPAISLDGLTEDVRIRVTAVDDGANTSEATRTYQDDTDSPTTLGFTFTSNSGNPAYAKAGDTVTMSFALTDTESGVNFSGIDLEIDSTSYSADLVGQGEGPFSVTHTLPAVGSPDPLFAGDRVPFLLTVSDNIGNPLTRNANDQALNYYHAAPTVAPPISFTKVPGPSGTADPDYLKSGDTLRATVTPIRDLNRVNTKLSFILNSTPTEISLPTVGTTYVYDFPITSSHASGTVAYSLAYEDLAGNTTTFTGATGKTVDQDAPELIVGSASLASNNADDSLAISGNTVTYTFDANDTLSGVAGTPTVAFTIGGTALAAQNAVGSGPWTSSLLVNSSTLQGAVSAKATISDAAGNSATLNASSGVLIDSVGPRLVGTPTPTSSGGATTAKIGDTITLAFTLDDAARTGEDPSVTFSVAGTSRSATVTQGASRKQWTATYVVEDTDSPASVPDINGSGISASITVRDDNGNSESLTSGTASTITVDNDNPTATTPSNPGIFFTGVSVTVTSDVSDNNTLSSVTIGGGTATLVGGNTYRRTFNLPATAGSYDLQVVATDAVGNSVTSTRNLTLVHDTTDPVISTPTYTGSFTTGDSVVVSVNITDNHTVDSVMIEGGAATNTVGDTWTRTITMPSTPDSTYSVDITAEDESGNTASTSDPQPVTDNDAPTITNISAPSTGTAGSVIRITFEASDNVSVAFATVNGFGATNTGGSNYGYDFTLPATPQTVTITIVATDSTGLQTTDATTTVVVN